MENKGVKTSFDHIITISLDNNGFLKNKSTYNNLVDKGLINFLTVTEHRLINDETIDYIDYKMYLNNSHQYFTYRDYLSVDNAEELSKKLEQKENSELLIQIEEDMLNYNNALNWIISQITADVVKPKNDTQRELLLNNFILKGGADLIMKVKSKYRVNLITDAFDKR